MDDLPTLAYRRPEHGHPNGVQLGGLGTGRIEIGSNGRLTLAGITNNWQRLLADLPGAFFCLRTAQADQSVFRLLQRDGMAGSAPMATLRYRGRHPVAEVAYRDPVCPITVDLRAFAPMIPHDAIASRLPGVVLDFTLSNPTAQPVAYRLGVSWDHLIGCGGHGYRGWSLIADRTGNAIRPLVEPAMRGLLFTGGNPAQHPNTRGEMLLALDGATPGEVWAYSFWNTALPPAALLRALARGDLPGEFDAGTLDSLYAAWRQRQAGPPPSWDDPDPRFGGGRAGIEGAIHPAAILGVAGTLEAGACATLRFALAWHTPHHQTTLQPGVDHGHAYQREHHNVVSVARRLLAEGGALSLAAGALARHLDGSDLPVWLSDKLLNDNTALTTNSIVTHAGDLYTLEASPMMFGALGTLDQRLIAHAGYSLFFPDLNRTELRTFARLQAPDGSLPHFNGNAHTALGSAAVEYGVTGWPDLACSFIIQVYRDWIETGEASFAEECRPAVRRAYEWLASADRDGDGIPEGGSSWDIEHYPGCFIATATLWLAVLRIMSDWARRDGDRESESRAGERFCQARRTVEDMWCGTHYRKYHDTRTGLGSDDVFIGQLEGEWVARSLGLPGVLDPERVRLAMGTLYRLNGDTTRYRLMPIQVRPDGTLPERKYGWHAWPQYGMVFLDALAMLMNDAERGMASVARFDQVVRAVNGAPWATTLWHDARDGRPDFESFIGLDWYMNTPAAWFVLSGLSGFQPDEPAEALTMGPWLPPGQTAFRYPVVTPRYWAYLTVETVALGRVRVVFEPVRFFRGDAAVRVRRIRWRGVARRAALVRPESLGLRGEPVGDYTDLMCPALVSLRAGQCLELEIENPRDI